MLSGRQSVRIQASQSPDGEKRLAALQNDIMLSGKQSVRIQASQSPDGNKGSQRYKMTSCYQVNNQ